jgi:hypothetical protein
MAAGLDEDLEIWSSGLKLSVDANAIKHMHAIFEPIFGRLFSENTSQQAQDQAQRSEGEGEGGSPPMSPGRKRKQSLARAASGRKIGVELEGRRGALVGSLWLLMKATKEREAAQRLLEGDEGAEGKEGDDDEEDFNGCRIKWARSLLEQRGRYLLLVRLHVECVTVDVVKAIDDEEESPHSSLLEQVLRVHIVGNTFHAVTVNARLAKAQMVGTSSLVLRPRSSYFCPVPCAS